MRYKDERHEQQMNVSKIVLHALLLVFAISVITVLVIKRFAYFKPTRQLLGCSEAFDPVQHRGINARWFGRSSMGTVLFCIGNRGNMSHRQYKINALLQRGLSVLIFDYSGFGLSHGIASEQTCYDDAASMAGFLMSHIALSKIVVYGEGIGAAVAACVSRRFGLGCLVLDSPVPSIVALLESRCKMARFLKPLFPEFDVCKYLEGYRATMLLVHNRNDKTITMDMIEDIKAYATRIVLYDGTDEDTQVPWELISEFIKAYLSDVDHPPYDRQHFLT